MCGLVMRSISLAPVEGEGKIEGAIRGRPDVFVPAVRGEGRGDA
jgi:hypothetical protein